MTSEVSATGNGIGADESGCCRDGGVASNGRKTVPLTQLRPGETGVICSAGSDPSDAALLRAMGLRMNATVRMCRAGEPCIVSVLGARGCSCRIGLARPLAERVVIGVAP